MVFELTELCFCRSMERDYCISAIISYRDRNRILNPSLVWVHVSVSRCVMVRVVGGIFICSVAVGGRAISVVGFLESHVLIVV